MINKKNIALLTILIVLVVTSVFFVKSRGGEDVAIEPEIEVDIPKPKFSTTNLLAKSVIVKDINSNEVLYSKNEHQSLPLASITKIMTVYAADLLLGNTRSVTITNSALSTYGEYGFGINEIWPTKSLEAYTLIVSSNDGAAALAEAAGGTKTSSLDSESKKQAFINYMNSLAKEIGLHNTNFKNPSGLDSDDTEPQAFGSAQDIANLFQYILIKNPSVLEPSVQVYDTFYVNNKTYRAENTNEIVGTIPSLIASKTGFTDAAGGNLAVVYDSGLNRPVVIVVLGSTKEGRFQDMSKLIENTQKYYADMEEYHREVEKLKDESRN